jgi:hypothetical protein
LGRGKTIENLGIGKGGNYFNNRSENKATN